MYGRADIVAGQAGTVPVTVKLSQAGRLLLGDHARATIELLVDYTGSGGLPQRVGSFTLAIRR